MVEAGWVHVRAELVGDATAVGRLIRRVEEARELKAPIETIGDTFSRPFVPASFVREALDEALKLESALARLRSPNRIALLHYAPIQATVEGEPLEIYPFLGSSRLEDPINRYEVDAVLHGHAHHGSPEGCTSHPDPGL